MTGRKAFGLAALGYTAFALALTRGLIGHFSTAVPHDLGDPLLSTWILWWNAHHLPFTGAWWDGLSFYPEHGSLAFSDHRVGLGFIAGPLQWLGGTPVLAYNVTFLSCFVFSALAAHALTWTLTRSHAAGLVSGLIFGFNPYRMAHLAHLELQAAYWLPLALVALHHYVRRFETRWLVLFSAFLALQGLSSGYYFFFSAPLIGLWILWFARDAPWRRQAAIVGAGAAAFLVLLPVLLRYQTIQHGLGMARTFGEMEDFSADITGLLSAEPGMALWRVPSLAANPEAEIYLGIVAPLLVLAAMLWRMRDRGATPERWHVWRLSGALVSVVYAFVALSTVFGSWTMTVGPLVIAAGRTEKPLAIAVLLLLVVGLTSSRFRGVVRQRSTFAFYVVAAVVTWSFSLGPRPKLLGTPLLYRGPYSFLMALPGFDYGFRAPARFIMMTILAVAVAAGIALVRLTASVPARTRWTVTAFLVLAIAADSWVPQIPVFAAPAPLPPAAASGAAVLELPLGETFEDITATYHSIDHQRPVVNGYSGYDPPHYHVLRLALKYAVDDSIFSALAEHGAIVVSVDRGNDPKGTWAAYVTRQGGASPLPSSDRNELFLLPRTQPERIDEGTALPIRSAHASSGDLQLAMVTDGNPNSKWRASHPQRAGDQVVIELDGVHTVNTVELGMGKSVDEFPRALAIDISDDGTRWEQRWRGFSGGTAFRAVLASATRPVLRFPVGGSPARFVRLTELANDRLYNWSIGELTVRGSR